MAYESHSRWMYLNYDEIQDYINKGILNEWDIVICKDTREFLMIGTDYNLFPINSKVNRYTSVVAAEIDLNKRKDTYEGQIVAILYGNAYTGYIVNRSKLNNVFYVSPLNVYEGEVNYDTLGNRPIENVRGYIGEPVILDTLPVGQYNVIGQYKISEDAETTYVSNNSNIFLVDKDDDGTYIKRISAKQITDFNIINNEIITSVVPTTEWLKAQGYTNSEELDAKLAVIEINLQQEMMAYIREAMAEAIDDLIDERIEHKINEKFVPATEDEIEDLFVGEVITNG